MKKMVYVIGAGASTEFGPMPVGQELARSIQALARVNLEDGYSDNALVRHALSYRGYGAGHEKALERIRDSVLTRDSIDDFVAEWNDLDYLADVSRYCIAHEILRGESQTTLGQIAANHIPIPWGLEQLRGSWLDTIVRYTNPEIGRRRVGEALAGTSFITFNYDRCIEYYLYLYLSNSLGMPANDARIALSQIAVEHVYGVAGDLPEIGGHIRFGLVEPSLLSRAADPIRTYCESVDSERVARIQDLVNDAERVVFLGCAFHSQNLELLFGGNPPSGEVWATTYGIRKRQWRCATEFFAKLPVLKSAEMKAGDFLTHYYDDLF